MLRTTLEMWLMARLSGYVCMGVVGSHLHARGPPRRVSAYEISKSTRFHVDFGFQIGFLDFTWISGFQIGFLDFTWISGFQSGFLHWAIPFNKDTPP